jgi:hypothetical protein
MVCDCGLDCARHRVVVRLPLSCLLIQRLAVRGDQAQGPIQRLALRSNQARNVWSSNSASVEEGYKRGGLLVQRTNGLLYARRLKGWIHPP